MSAIYKIIKLYTNIYCAYMLCTTYVVLKKIEQSRHGDHFILLSYNMISFFFPVYQLLINVCSHFDLRIYS